MYVRVLCLQQRIKVAHTYLLSKLWYAAQVFPLPTSLARQLTTAILWFIWHRAIFRVPTATLYRRASEGGLELVHLHAKCATLYLLHLRQQHDATGTFTAAWLRQWNRFNQTANPPELHRMPQVLTYLQPFFLEWAYCGRRLEAETQRALRRRVYGMLREYNNEIIPRIPTRIHERHPSKNWWAIWGNVNMAHFHDAVKSVWHRATHDILPTNERLRRINLSAAADCQECGVMGTPIYGLTQCGEAAEIRDWTRKRIALFHRIDPKAIPLTWLLFPDFRLWPSPKHNATLWILRHMVY
jgi:hypothetical protein